VSFRRHLYLVAQSLVPSPLSPAQVVKANDSSICPNASRVLSFFEFNFERARPTLLEQVQFSNTKCQIARSNDCFLTLLKLGFFDGTTLQQIRSRAVPDFAETYGHPFLLYHRADLHNELKRTATQSRPHTSNTAKINLLSEVSDIDLDGHILLADGRKVYKDVVIVADGIRVGSLPC
jgi:hypothetical protein